MHIPAYLSARQVRFETLRHPPAYTAQRRAKYLRVPGRTVVKSVLLRGPRGLLLAALPATRQIDTDRLSRFLQQPVRLAGTEEIAATFPDCEWGVVSPFGAIYGVETLLEDSLNPDDELVFEGNSHTEAIRMRCRDYEEIEHPRRANFAHTPPQTEIPNTK